VSILRVFEKSVQSSVKVCTNYKMEEYEMGGTCSTFGDEEERMQGSGRLT
jgi:hypothetical protein